LPACCEDVTATCTVNQKGVSQEADAGKVIASINLLLQNVWQVCGYLWVNKTAMHESEVGM